MLFRRLEFYAIGALLLLLSACGAKQTQQQQGPPPAMPVTTDTADATNAIYYDEYPGTTVALNQVDIRAQVTGYITGIYFKEENKIKKGQKMYTIEQQLYNANY